ncbi:MAG: sulfur carrier protein ThiS [Bacteroidales bacterium]|nr:sulfur carrier protein ThiS [Bacteroidales bacterium]MBN2758667.1 sulfur carrier protein ThiS [Bacteroidales bacterium]
MKIKLNNRDEIIEKKDKISFEELINYKNYSFHMLVTKLNDKLVKKENRKTTFIKDGDNVIVMHLISGG